MRILAFCGPRGSGKDEALAGLRGRIPEEHFINLKFADPIKFAICDFLSLDYEELDCIKDDPVPWLSCQATPRDFLKTIGAAVRNEVHKDVWVDIMRRQIDWNKRHFPEDRNGRGKVGVITDLRYDNEAALVRDLGGSIIKIRRTLNADGSRFLAAGTHESEVGIGDDQADHVIINNGTDRDAFHAEVVRTAAVLPQFDHLIV